MALFSRRKKDKGQTDNGPGPSLTQAEPLPEPRPLHALPVVRAGVISWSIVGLVLVAAGLAAAAGHLSLVVYPVILALFPAALLSPLSNLFKRILPNAAAALLTLLVALGGLTAVVWVLVPQVQQDLPELVDNINEGIIEVQEWIEETRPFGMDMEGLISEVEQYQDQAVQWAQEGGVEVATGLATGIVQFTTMTVLMLVILFFFLKDGHSIGLWLRDLFPRETRPHAEAIGGQIWNTVGGYFRGQLAVALVDAVFIGIGLWILGVPLVLPLAVLVFFGGLFPIVGAFVSGTLAVLVALASEGFVTALLTLAVVVVVQQVESNVLAPILLSRATAIHPLAVLVSLTVGAVLLNLLGAFIAVPVAASISKTTSYLRKLAESRRQRRTRQPLHP